MAKMRKHYKIDWNTLSQNEAAIEILKKEVSEHPGIEDCRVSFSSLSENPALFKEEYTMK